MSVDVLALNRSWLAINIIPTNKAIKLLCKGHAKAVEIIDIEKNLYNDYSWEEWLEYNGIYDNFTYEQELCMNESSDKLDNIHTVRLKIPIPEIIVMKYYDKLPRRTVVFSKENLFIRDDSKCVYCGKELKFKDATIDHIHPQSKGGRDSFDNCVISCKSCNHEKADYLLDELSTHNLKSDPKYPSSINPLYRFKTRIKVKDSWKHFIYHI